MFEFSDLKLHGTNITTEQLEQLLSLEPRRHRLCDPSWFNLPWSALRVPLDATSDWCLSFPFFETFCPAFDEFCRTLSGTSAIDRLPFERLDGKRVNYTFLKNTSEDQLNDIGQWISIVSCVVGIRDFLRVSFALGTELAAKFDDISQGEMIDFLLFYF